MQAAAYPVQAVIPESIKTPEATLHLLPVLDTDAASTSLNAKCGVGMSHPDFNVSGCSSCSVSCPGLFPAPLPILKVEVPWHLPLARWTYAREGLQSYLASCRSRELDLRVNRLVSQCHLHPQHSSISPFATAPGCM